MTRKHFEALAAALKDSKPDPPNMDGNMDGNWSEYREALAQWRADVHAIAAVCLAHNPRFAGDRFLYACDYRAFSGMTVGPHNQPAKA